MRRRFSGHGMAGVILFALLAGIFLLYPGESDARHDIAQSCDICHKLQAGQTHQGSYSIYSGVPIGIPTPVSEPFNCDVCHTDFTNEFKDLSVRSNHPAYVVNTTTTLMVPNSANYPKKIRCLDCHRGDTYSPGANNLSPDLGPGAYDNAVRGVLSDGYPNHDLSAYDQIIPLTDTMGNTNYGPLVRLLGPYPYYNYAVDNATYSGGSNPYGACFACHGATAADNTSRGVNVKAEYDFGGHYFRSGTDANKRVSCYVCHDTHTSYSVGLYKRPGGGAVTDNNGRAVCIDCHLRNGADNGANPSVSGVSPPAPTTNVTGHPNYSTAGNRTSEACGICHKEHYPEIGTASGGYACLDCHTTAAIGGNRTKPANGAYDFSYIDNLFKGIGYVDNGALPAGWSQHDVRNSADCRKCHGDLHRTPASSPRLIDPDAADGYAFDGTPADINDFCLSCHDGGNQADTQFDGKNPKNVAANWVAKGHGKITSPAAVKCTDCHAVHGSDVPKLLLHSQALEPNVRKSFTNVKIASGTLSSVSVSALDYLDYTDKANANGAGVSFDNNWKSDKGADTGKTFGTAGDPANQYGSNVTAGPTGATVGLCDACHRSSTHTATTTDKAHTHMGIRDQGDPKSQMSFVRDCVECHNPHGTANIYMVADNVYTRDNPTGRTVTFTDNTMFDTSRVNNEGDLCTVCHDNPAAYSLNVSHNYFTPDNTSHKVGQNCLGCHAHGATDNVSKYGFPQGGACNSCHGWADADGMPSYGDVPYAPNYDPDANNLLGTRGGDNTAHSIHVKYLTSKPMFGRGTALNRAEACYVCHNGGGSYEDGGHPKNGTYTNYQFANRPDNTYLQVVLDNGVAGKT